MTRVYKILPLDDWRAAEPSGAYHGSPKDLEDGFIHLSTAAQAGETARLHFAGQAGLALAAFQADDLGPALRWEASRGGELFPHLYAPLPTVAALSVVALALNAEGWPDPGALAP